MRSARAGSIGLHVRWAWGGAISSLFDKYFRVLTLDVIFLVCLTPNQLKVTKMTPKLVPRQPQNPLKIKENPGLDSQVTSGVSPRTPGSPNLSPRVPKWSLQASQMTLWPPKLTLSNKLPVLLVLQILPVFRVTS